MNDTNPGIRKKMLELMQSKSEAEKLFMTASMFDAVRSITRATILEARPDISPAEYSAELFERWYGEDFEPDVKKKIVSRLRQKL